MPVCVECGALIATTVRRENGVLVAAQCPSCLQTSDKHAEHNVVHLCLDLLLLRRSAWTHAVYNAEVRHTWRPLLLLVLVACLLEAFVVCVSSTHRLPWYVEGAAAPTAAAVAGAPSMMELSIAGSPNAARGTSAVAEAAAFAVPTAPPALRPQLRSLQIVRVSKATGGGLPTWELARMFCFAVAEFAVVGVGLLWGMTAVGAEEKETAAAHMCQAVALAGTARLGYVLFLIWDIPLYLLGVVEVATGLWTYMSAQAIVGDSLPRSLFITCAALMIRLLFRSLTHWCPPFAVSSLWDPSAL